MHIFVIGSDPNRNRLHQARYRAAGRERKVGGLSWRCSSPAKYSCSSHSRRRRGERGEVNGSKTKGKEQGKENINRTAYRTGSVRLVLPTSGSARIGSVQLVLSGSARLVEPNTRQAQDDRNGKIEGILFCKIEPRRNRLLVFELFKKFHGKGMIGYTNSRIRQEVKIPKQRSIKLCTF